MSNPDKPSCSYHACPREVEEPDVELSSARKFLTRKLDENEDNANLPDNIENYLIMFSLERLSQWRAKNYRKMYQNKMQDDGENLSTHFNSFNEFYSEKLDQLRKAVEILDDRYKKDLRCHCTLVAKFLALKIIIEEELVACAKKYQTLFEKLQKEIAKEVEMRADFRLIESQMHLLRSVTIYEEEVDLKSSPFDAREIAAALLSQLSVVNRLPDDVV